MQRKIVKQDDDITHNHSLMEMILHSTWRPMWTKGIYRP